MSAPTHTGEVPRWWLATSTAQELRDGGALVPALRVIDSDWWLAGRPSGHPARRDQDPTTKHSTVTSTTSTPDPMPQRRCGRQHHRRPLTVSAGQREIHPFGRHVQDCPNGNPRSRTPAPDGPNRGTDALRYRVAKRMHTTGLSPERMNLRPTRPHCETPVRTPAMR